MNTTPKLLLPYIMQAQAQKHITHNEAIRALDAIVQTGVIDRDLAAPPASPSDGDRYIIADGAAGDWAGKEYQIAAWQDGAWMFYTPREGWLAWVGDEDQLCAWDGNAWTLTGGSVNPVGLVGVNTTADATNKLAVKSDAVLFSHDDVTPGNGSIQHKLNKSGADKTASFLFQDDWSGRAEIGLAGDDDFHFKVSPDGSSWKDAIQIDRSTGAVSLPFTQISGAINAVTEYGAKADGVTDDAAAIQAALDFVDGKGGGGVFLPPGIYLCSNVLEVHSNTHLSGAGFSSIIRNPAGALPGKTISGVSVYASIAMVGVSNARVSNLTVDHATNVSQVNGVIIGEYGASVRSTDCAVEQCQMLGHDNHQYQIYNKLADRTHIRDNYIIGHVPGIPVSDVAGIEIFGGEDVKVSGNDIRHCVEGIIAKTEDGIDNSYLKGIDIHDNRVDACVNCITVRIATGTGNASKNILVHDNIATNATNRGATISVTANAVAENIQLQANLIRNCHDDVVIDQNASAQTDGLVLAENQIVETDTTRKAIYLTGAKNAVVRGNSVGGAPSIAFYMVNVTDVEMRGNTVTGANAIALDVDGATRLSVIGNSFIDYGKGGSANGVRGANSAECLFAGNYFKFSSAGTEFPAIDLLNTCSVCEIGENYTGYIPAGSAFYNRGSAGRTNHTAGFWQDNGSGSVKQIGGTYRRPVGFGATQSDLPEASVDLFRGTVRIRQPSAPASAGAAGNAGEIQWSSTHVYVCVGTNSWKRAALSSW